MFFLTDTLEFPPVEEAQSDGLLAVGGNLSTERLLLAYKNGIFPWFNDDALILWWSPKQRMVLFPEKIKISKSMRKVMRNGHFELTVNTDFEQVIERCSKIKRKDQQGTWITNRMIKAYTALHYEGYATSYEVWHKNKLVGGLYGIDLGHIFCGESMFSTVSDASKFAFISLAQRLHEQKYALIDCQLYTEHLKTLGAEEISRDEFLKILKTEDQRGK